MSALLARLLGRSRPTWSVVVDSRPVTSADGALERFDLRLEAPAERERELVRHLARTVVMVAERPRRDDDRFHLVGRGDGEPEACLTPLGPSLQTLGERAALELARTASGRRTALWLCLPATSALAAVVDPTSFDPETEAAIDDLVAGGGLRWAVAATLARDRRRVAARLLLWLDPEPGRALVETVVEHLRAVLAGDGRDR